MTLVTSAIVFIVAAFLLYTLAVWSERIAGRLKAWHLAVFWLGFAADTTGTSMMMQIAQTTRLQISLGMAAHGITGMLALTLMFGHCAWASLVLLRRDEEAILGFHRFSLLVWAIWMIPFLIGAAMEGLR